MMRLRFEKPSKRAATLSWQHGNYFDLWSLLHIISGVFLGLLTYWFSLPFLASSGVIILLLIAYEFFELVIHENESLTNEITDVILGFGSFVISYVVFTYLEASGGWVLFLAGALLASGITLGFFGLKNFVLKNYNKRHAKKKYVYINMSWRKIVYFAVVAAPGIFVWQLDAKAGITWLSIAILLGLYLIYKRKVGQELLIALLFALFITSYHPYVYDSANIFIGRINLFPLAAWTAGLVLLREVYERINVERKWFAASALYIAVLFVLEVVGYYQLNIRLDANDPSLLGLGIIHGPPVMHLFYTLAGPVYLAVTDYLKVK